MKPEWEATTAEGYTAKAVFDPKTGLYTVTVDTPKGVLSEEFRGMYEPRFGIDVADAQRAQEVAERLLESLEAK